MARQTRRFGQKGKAARPKRGTQAPARARTRGTPPRRRGRFVPGWRTLRYGAIALAGACVMGLAGAAALWHHLFHDLPSLPDRASMWTLGRTPAIEYRAQDGTLIDIRGPRYGRRVTLDDLPDHVPQAFIAAEDKRFYDHEGADPMAILRAAWVNWRTGQTVSGASTITQQLVKNLVLSPERTLKRKAQEIRLAYRLERQLTKDEILEVYLNRVYFGSGFYGLDAAATFYFGVAPADLSFAQAALLAGLPKAPSKLALDSNLDAALARQDYVLDQMEAAGYLTAAEARAAREAPIDLVDRGTGDVQMGYVLDLAAERIPRILPDAPPDLVVTLTVEPDLQRAVREILADRLADVGEAQSVSQGAALVLRPEGRVAALVGGVDYAQSEFNRVTQARRQPGSAFKALLFAAALEQGMRPEDRREDRPFRIGDWQPKNYGGQHLGPVTLSEAFARSLNTVSAELLQEVGGDAVIRLARRFGIRADLQPLPSLALGSQEVTLWELTRAYGVFLREGRRMDPYLIARIEDTRGKVLYERPDFAPVQVYDRTLAHQMTNLLAGVVTDGTGGAAAVEGRDVAGKTGTSQDWRDAWFVGFVPSAVIGVWIGNDDDSAMDRVAGGDLPAELFADIVRALPVDEAPRRLPGVQRRAPDDPARTARLAYYRDLSQAFSELHARPVALAERPER